ncbi:KTSC domain-containing protein [Myxococcota bacterium]|nr:KTSC domain-containing protein [Myxococcota bacterium]
MELLLLFVVVAVGFAAAQWVHAGRPLSDAEVDQFAVHRRLDSLWEKFGWPEGTTGPHSLNRDLRSEKKSMPAKGGYRRCSETAASFPGFASSLLKSKKHEWILFGWGRDGSIDLYWSNKGPDRTRVAPGLSGAEIAEVAKKKDANVVIDVHNHPNPMPSRYAMSTASEQDLRHARVVGESLAGKGCSYVAYVAERGKCFPYALFVPDEWLPIVSLTDAIRLEAEGAPEARRGLRRRYRRDPSIRLANGRRFVSNLDLNFGGARMVSPSRGNGTPKLPLGRARASIQARPSEAYVHPLEGAEAGFIDVESSWIRGYRLGDSGTLFVLLTNGVTYVYRAVPAQLLQEFQEAPSKGKCLHKIIRNVGPGQRDRPAVREP